MCCTDVLQTSGSSKGLILLTDLNMLQKFLQVIACVVFSMKKPAWHTWYFLFFHIFCRPYVLKVIVFTSQTKAEPTSIKVPNLFLSSTFLTIFYPISEQVNYFIWGNVKGKDTWIIENILKALFQTVLAKTKVLVLTVVCSIKNYLKHCSIHKTINYTVYNLNYRLHHWVNYK